jgi:hypothetical protein
LGSGAEQATQTKKIKRMSKDIDANNNLADTATAFQNDWPFLNSNANSTKKQQDNVKALENFLAEMDEDMAKQNKFLRQRCHCCTLKKV